MCDRERHLCGIIDIIFGGILLYPIRCQFCGSFSCSRPSRKVDVRFESPKVHASSMSGCMEAAIARYTFPPSPETVPAYTVMVEQL